MVLRNVGEYPKTQRHIQQDGNLASKSLTTLYLISHMHATRHTYLIVLDSSQIVKLKALQLVRQTPSVRSYLTPRLTPRPPFADSSDAPVQFYQSVRCHMVTLVTQAQLG